MSRGQRMGYRLPPRFRARHPKPFLASDFSPLPSEADGYNPCNPTMAKPPTVAILVGALVVAGLVFFVRGQRAPKPPELPSVEGADAPPEGPNGRVAWFLRKYSERFADAQHKMAIEQGADIQLLPIEWPGPRYIADAPAYSNVETYFLGYLRYLDTAKERYPVLMDSIARITVVESKMESADSADVLKGISGGFASKRAANLRMFDDGQAYGQAALRLHYYLASLGSRVSYDYTANTAKFEVDAERERVSVLLAEVQRYGARLAAASKP
jgi:hypothetical protein